MRKPDWEAEAEKGIRHGRAEQNPAPGMKVASRENAEPGPGVRYRVHSVASTTGQTEAGETPVVAAAIVAAGVVVAAAAGVVAAAGGVAVAVVVAAATTKAVAPVRHRIELA